MIKLHDRYFVCSEGHITVGDDSRTKCSAENIELRYIKGKRKRSFTEEVVSKKPCGASIVKEEKIPDQLDLFSVWDYEVMHAFLIGQRIDAELMVFLQKSIVALSERITFLEEKK